MTFVVKKIPLMRPLWLKVVGPNQLDIDYQLAKDMSTNHSLTNEQIYDAAYRLIKSDLVRIIK